MQSSQRDERPSITKRKEIPYQPPQVSLADLDEQGRLIPEKTCSIIQKKILSKTNKLKKLGIDTKTGGKLSKKILRTVFGINTDFSLLITKQNNELKAFAIYRGEKKNKHLGKGSMGVVKVVQDIDTGTFYAAKYQTEKTPESDLRTAASRESHQLHIAGQLIANASFESPNRPGKRTHVIIMPLHSGVESRLLINQRKSPIQILALCCNVIDAVYDIHRRDVLHRDIKTENIIYDLINHHAGIIDFGHAVFTGAGLSITSKHLYGSPLYMPPEIFAKYLASKQGRSIEHQVTYSEKTDIYCLGLALARYFKLVKLIDKQDRTHCVLLDPKKDAELITATSPIPYEWQRQQIIKFLQRMTAVNPKARPSMEITREFFQDMRRQIRNLDGNTNHCAVIDINEYTQLNNSIKERFIENLLPFDDIQLVNFILEPDMTTIRRAHNELRSYGLAVRNKLLYSVKDLTTAVQELQSAVQHEPIFSTYHKISADKLHGNNAAVNNQTKYLLPPPQVDMADLGPDMRLISAKMLYDMKGALKEELGALANDTAKRISKSDIHSKYGIKSPYSIVIHKDNHGDTHLYAIYRGHKSGKQLGVGQHGAVKLIQDLQTSIFCTLKLTKAFANEDQLLHQSGALIAKFTYEPRSQRNRKKYAPRHGNDTPRIHAMITPFAKGRAINKVSPKHPTQLFQILLGMITATKHLHDKGILHNDLKPDHYIYDENQNTVKLIDLGMAINVGNHDVLAHLHGRGFRYGTAAYSCNQQPHIDVSKTATQQNLLNLDIYALGISMAQLAGLMNENFDLVDQQSSTYLNNKMIPNRQLRKQLWILIKRMTNENRNQRPNIDTVLEACKSITRKAELIYRLPNAVSQLVSSLFTSKRKTRPSNTWHSNPANDDTFKDVLNKTEKHKA